MAFFNSATRFPAKNLCSPGPATYSKGSMHKRASVADINESSSLSTEALSVNLHHNRRKSAMEISQRIHNSSTNLNELLPPQMQKPIIIRKSSHTASLINLSLKQFISADKKDNLRNEELSNNKSSFESAKHPPKKGKGSKGKENDRVVDEKIIQALKTKKITTKKCRMLNRTFNNLANEMQSKINKVQEGNISKVIELRKHVDFRKALNINRDDAGITESQYVISNDIFVHSYAPTIKSVGPGKYHVEDEDKTKSHNIRGQELYKEIRIATDRGIRSDSREKAKLKIDKYYDNASKLYKRSLSPAREAQYSYKKGYNTPSDKGSNKRVNFIELNKRLVNWQEKGGLKGSARMGSCMKGSTGGTKTPYALTNTLNPLYSCSMDKKSLMGDMETTLTSHTARDLSIQTMSKSPSTIHSARTHHRTPSAAVDHYLKNKSYIDKFLNNRRQMFTKAEKEGSRVMKEETKHGILSVTKQLISRKQRKGLALNSKGQFKKITYHLKCK